MNDAAAVLRAMVEIFATGDTSTVRSLVADAYVDHQGLRGETIRGPEGFARVVTAARSAGDLRVNIEDLIAQDDRAAARIRWMSTREADRETIDIIRVVDGQAVEHWGAAGR